MLASRISYVGELGWELYVPIETGARLWSALREAGSGDGLVPCGIGVYGTTGRLEKGYRAYGAELDGERTVVDAVDLSVPTGAGYGFLGPTGAGKTIIATNLLWRLSQAGQLSKPALFLCDRDELRGQAYGKLKAAFGDNARVVRSDQGANAAQNAMVGPDTSLVGGLISAGVLLGASAVVARLRDRIPGLRRALEGTPTLLISDGQLLANAIAAEGVDMEELEPVPYTHLRAHETVPELVCRLQLEKKKINKPCNTK